MFGSEDLDYGDVLIYNESTDTFLIEGKISNIIKKIWDTIINFIKKVWNAIKNAISAIFNKLTGRDKKIKTASEKVTKKLEENERRPSKEGFRITSSEREDGSEPDGLDVSINFKVSSGGSDKNIIKPEDRPTYLMKQRNKNNNDNPISTDRDTNTTSNDNDNNIYNIKPTKKSPMKFKKDIYVEIGEYSPYILKSGIVLQNTEALEDILRVISCKDTFKISEDLINSVGIDLSSLRELPSDERAMSEILLRFAYVNLNTKPLIDDYKNTIESFDRSMSQLKGKKVKITFKRMKFLDGKYKESEKLIGLIKELRSSSLDTLKEAMNVSNSLKDKVPSEAFLEVFNIKSMDEFSKKIMSYISGFYESLNPVINELSSIKTKMDTGFTDLIVKVRNELE